MTKYDRLITLDYHKDHRSHAECATARALAWAQERNVVVKIAHIIATDQSMIIEEFRRERDYYLTS